MKRALVDLIISLVCVSFFTSTALLPCAEAALIDTPAYLGNSGGVTQGDLQTFLLRKDVREQLVRLGVDPAAAADRIGSLTTEELAQLNQRIETLPAGSDVLAILGILLVVLLVLELLGVTNVFTRL